ncbi:MAG TPA: cyclopropane fatty acyl phospholipid synthase [Caldithrix abyssi]|uniref:Cyclopropane fatty acyl phospholipid synthase n=1 Tax=Caldithrix abyssi TaxID=187145 RepID=A0A7V5PNM4_CALAY|nr:cyclopropane fatty acyl phospholipid synthase [Caldithrix abyssi]
MSEKSKKIVESLLDQAGIKINGPNPYDIQVHDERLYDRVLSETALGLGESYMDGWWDCEALDEFFTRLLRARLDEKVKGNVKILWHALRSRLFNLQAKHRAHQVGKKHYDVGNDLYQRMLDKRLNYTCGYWKNAKNLDEAQEAKLELVCKKIGLQPGMTVLELGCGWGSFAKYAAEKYGVEVTGVTVSEEQVKLGRELCKGLPVKIELADYRTVTGQYDRVISIGIMEHVGYKNYRTYMEVVDRTLKDDGIAFIHTIGSNSSVTTANAWTTKYIFPNGMLPSIAQLGKAMEGLFVMEDWHSFGPDYDKTLMAWYANFEAAWPELKDKYGERFYRMWRYYLLSSAGGFRARQTQLWQIVMTKLGREQPECRFS